MHLTGPFLTPRALARKYKVTVEDVDEEDGTVELSSDSDESEFGEGPNSSTTESDEALRGHSSGSGQKRKGKRTKNTKGSSSKRQKVDHNPTAAQIEQGIEMVDIDAAAPLRKDEKSRDVSQFFSPPYQGEDKKTRRDCKKCSR